MELYLVRHGETSANLGLDCSHETRLTPVGLEQADYLGRSLKNVHFDRIYASNMPRAVQTAAGVAKYQPGTPEIIIVPELAERDTPWDWEPDVEFQRTVYPNLVYLGTKMARRYPGDAERAADVLQRLVYDPAYKEATEVTMHHETEIRSNPQKILIVCHCAFNGYLLSDLIGFRFDVNVNIAQHNTCVNRMRLFLCKRSGNRSFRFPPSFCMRHVFRFQSLTVNWKAFLLGKSWHRYRRRFEKPWINWE